ncbi:MAG: endonuclease III [Candidatus Krumholzibacteriota bacterium]|nr:endonuclease III [Candidatus Krumholzibacteriota bacterium]
MPRERAADRQRRAEAVLAALDRLYPAASCGLSHEDPYQLWVATVLSAQCTDARVNAVTPALFAAAPDAAALARLPQRRLEDLIRPTGVFRNKARNLRAAARLLVERHDGGIPRTMDELRALPGVGRKTANVILGNAFGVPGLPVDTHVGRLARRLGFSRQTDPVKVERDLARLFPPSRWTLLGHQLIAHGRAVCASRRPRCEDCALAPHCPSAGRAGA